jgi:hypothetical protein
VKIVKIFLATVALLLTLTTPSYGGDIGTGPIIAPNSQSEATQPVHIAEDEGDIGTGPKFVVNMIDVAITILTVLP